MRCIVTSASGRVGGDVSVLFCQYSEVQLVCERQRGRLRVSSIGREKCLVAEWMNCDTSQKICKWLFSASLVISRATYSAAVLVLYVVLLRFLIQFFAMHSSILHFPSNACVLQVLVYIFLSEGRERRQEVAVLFPSYCTAFVKLTRSRRNAAASAVTVFLVQSMLVQLTCLKCAAGSSRPPWILRFK